MEEEEGKRIRVVDRRMFTPEGELRADFQPEEEPEKPSPPAASPRSAPPVEPHAEKQERPAGEPAGDFASVVRSLATTAYASLGLVPDPATGAIMKKLKPR